MKKEGERGRSSLSSFFHFPYREEAILPLSRHIKRDLGTK